MILRTPARVLACCSASSCLPLHWPARRWSSHYRDCNILGLQKAGCHFSNVGRRTWGGACKHQRHTSHTVPAQSLCCWTLIASVPLAPACLHNSSQGIPHPGQGRHHHVALHVLYEPLKLEIMGCTWVQRRPEAKLYACMGASAWAFLLHSAVRASESSATTAGCCLGSFMCGAVLRTLPPMPCWVTYAARSWASAVTDCCGLEAPRL